MKVNKKIFISALLVLVMLGIMGTASATDSLDNDNMTAEDAVSVDVGDSLDDSLKSAESDLLSEGEATIYVDGSYDGDEQGTEDKPYKTISSAVSAATTGGETIFIKDGEYTQDTKFSFTKSINFVGESRDGVIIKSTATNGVFETVENGVVLSFKNLNFIDITAGSIGTLNVGGDSNLDVINCTFDNCKSKYGVMWIKTTGTVNIEDVDILNSAATTNKGATAIYFQGAGNYNIKNTLIDNAQNTVTGFSYAPIYTVNAESSLTVDNVRIYNCGGNTYAMIYTNGIATVTNSRIINNTVPGATGKSIIYAARNTLTIEQTVFVNNSATNYLVFCNTGGTAVLNYNYIANNTITTSGADLPVYGAGTSGTNSINADSNYWGSNDPTITGTTVNNYVIVNDAGDYVLNDGSPLPEGKTIPSVDEPSDEPVGDENSTFVSVDGDDSNTGSADSPVATIAKAVELAKGRTGEIIINEGTYTENGIEIDSDIPISIIGDGNVVIDGNADTISIFILSNNPSVSFTNIKFRNSRAQNGGAIKAMGSSNSNTIVINVTVDHCTFEDMAVTKQGGGGAIYLKYASGYLQVTDSSFTNLNASGTWGGAISVGYSIRGGGGLYVLINGSTFEDCSANNGGACYLQARTVDIMNSIFSNNHATADSGAIYIYNSTASIDNCEISDNDADRYAAAIQASSPTGYTSELTITNSIIENNVGASSTLPAIYVDKVNLDISYSSIVNDLSVGTSSATATVNNNWWGTNDPSSKTTGSGITMNNWVIMNVVADVTEAIPGDEVTLTVDFNHVNTTAGEIEELTGGVIPKTYEVQLSSNDGTIVPSTLTISDGATKSAVYTVGDLYDIVSVSCDEALVELSFVPEVPPYYGIIYVSKDGSDDNNGSEEAPVASIAKAVELATLVGGSHQIIINEGTYKPGASITITDDLTITGDGAVVIDADGIEKLIDMPYSSPVKGFTVELNNMALINGNGNQYGTVYNYADAYLFLNNVNISDCTGSYLGGIITTTGNTTITDCVISDCTAGRIIYASVGYNKPIAVTLVNTTLKDNVAFIDDGSDIGQGYAAIDVSTTTKNTVLNLIDSHFISNTGKLGTVYTTSNNVVMNVEGTEFIDNTVLTGNGGAINGYSMNINNSTFINNRATKDYVGSVATGGAINIGRLGTAVITNSKFVGNSATGNGNTIYNGWKLTINNCAIIDNTQGNVIYHNGEDNVMDAKYNWWGTNDDPSSLIGTGEYEDDYGYGYEDCEFDASKWVVMNVVNNLTSEDPLDINDTIVFAVDFAHYTDSTGTLYELADKIPEVEVSADAIKGFFDKDSATTEGNAVTFVYTADIGGVDEINITSAKAVNTTLININEPIVVEVVYVSPNGDDSNVGYFDEPVATIAHAIEIAERGKIVIFEGTYAIDSTLAINKDLDIRGYENDVVTIDGGLKRIIENNANLNLTNLVFTNAKNSNGAAIANYGNLTIDGCTFYNNTATSGTGGSIILNSKGTMTVDNSIFYDDVASRGVINSASGTELTVNNSEFYDNDMTLVGTFTSSTTFYGIVYANSANAVIENTVFRNNKVKNGGAIYASKATSATTGDIEVINCTFEDNTAVTGTGGALFISGKTQANIVNSTFINNTASGTTYAGGAIYTTGTSKAIVVSSVFIDNYGCNYQDVEDAGIYVGATATSSSSLDISNSVIIPREGFTGYAVNAADGAIVSAENNFWGDNSKANTNANVEKWVIMTADYDQEKGILTVVFNSTNSTDGTIADYDDVLPDGFNVSVSSSSGGLDETLPVIAGQASTRYTAVVADTFIAVECADAEVIIPVVVEPHIIYVAVDGDDNNDGSKDAPVATIAKAIELADEGLIVIQEGTYTTTDLGIISDDLNITGNGTVVIDAQNSDRILYVGSDASVVLKNLIMVNGASLVDSGALLGNANELTLINCTLANSSAGQNNGGAIYNVGKLTIINSTIANNTAKMGGAIFTNSYAELTIINSTFENNKALGNDNSGGGAIFAQQLAGLFIDNSSFIENEALDESSGGAIFVSHSDAEYTITNSRFIANHANGKDNTGGGAIYMVGLSNTQKSGKLSISNTLFEENTADTCGAAIYARATTVDVSNSVIFANKDPSGFAVYGYKTDTVTPTITLNDNWWGFNDDPNDFVGGYNYKPTLTRWVILTATNDTPFVEGNTVKITVDLNTWTDGEENGTLATPITIPRDVVIDTTSGSIEGVMENGEFTTDYVVPEDLKLVAVNVDIQYIELLKVKTGTVVEIDNITAYKGDTVNITATVKSEFGFIVFEGEVEVYFDDELVATIPVVTGTAMQEVVIDKEVGEYNILAKFIDLSGDLKDSEANATLKVIRDEATLSIADIIVDEFNFVTIIVEMEEVPEGEITFTVEGNDVSYNGTVPIKEFQAIYDVPEALVSGDYTVTASFAGDNHYYPAEDSEIFTVELIPVTVEVADITAIKDDVVNVSVTVQTSEGFMNIDSGEVKVYFGDDLVATIPVVEGVAIQEVMIDKDSGVYDILAVYTDSSAIYEGSSGSAVLNVTKMDANLKITEIAVDEFNNVVITVEIDDNVVGSVTFTVSGEGASYTQDVPIYEGYVFYEVPEALTSGNYTVTASFKGDEYYYPAEDSEIFTVELIPVTVEVADITAIKDDVVNVSVTVQTSEGFMNIDSGEVKVYFGDDLVATIPVVEGVAIQEVMIDKDSGVYDILAVYTDSSAMYDSSSGSAVLNVTKMDANLKITEIDADELNNVVITVEIDDNVVGSVTFTVSGEGVKYTQDVPIDEGYVFYEVPEALTSGNYTVTASFKGDEYYYPAEDSEVIYMSRIDTSLSAKDIAAVHNVSSRFYVTLMDVKGNPIVGAKVNLVLGHINKTVRTDASGRISASTVNLDSGNYTAVVSFAGNEMYNPSNTTANVFVKYDSVLSANDIVAVYNVSSRFYVTLMDTEGNPISGARVNLVLGPINKTVRTDAKGRISASTKNLDQGNYTALVSFAGNEIYGPSNTTANVFVDKIATELSADDVVALYNVSSRLYVTLKDANGNPIVGAKVNLVLGPINKTVKTDAKGRISASTKNLDLGDYTAMVSFAGDDIYKPSSMTAKVQVKAGTVLSADDVVGVYNESSKLYVYLKDTDGNAIAGAKVKVVLGSITKTVKTNANGRISVSTKALEPGDYTAKISYAGDDTYYKSETTANVFIDKIDTTLSANDVVAVHNVGSRLYATLKDADGNVISGAKVNMVLGNINKTVKTDAKGRVSASTKNLDPGSYTAVVSFAGNEIYKPSSTTANVVVSE